MHIHSFTCTDTFKLTIEYGPSFRDYGEQHGGKVRLPKALATLELTWTSDESEAEVVERLAQVSLFLWKSLQELRH